MANNWTRDDGSLSIPEWVETTQKALLSIVSYDCGQFFNEADWLAFLVETLGEHLPSSPPSGGA